MRRGRPELCDAKLLHPTGSFPCISICICDCDIYISRHLLVMSLYHTAENFTFPICRADSTSCDETIRFFFVSPGVHNSNSLSLVPGLHS